jgi:hypothetical protein
MNMFYSVDESQKQCPKESSEAQKVTYYDSVHLKSSRRGNPWGEKSITVAGSWKEGGIWGCYIMGVKF